MLAGKIYRSIHKQPGIAFTTEVRKNVELLELANGAIKGGNANASYDLSIFLFYHPIGSGLMAGVEGG